MTGRSIGIGSDFDYATVKYSGPNVAPAAADDSYDVDEDDALSVPIPGVLGNDTDPNLDDLTAALVTGPVHAASFTLNADGSFTYTPTANYNGSDSFTYQAYDGALYSNTATVTITVDSVNDAPVLDPIGDKSVDEEQLLTFTATAGDPSDDPPNNLAFSLVDAPSGAAIDANTGVFTWTPDESQGPGQYTFDVVVTDDGEPVMSDSETITVTVGEVDQVETVLPNAFAVQKGLLVAGGLPELFSSDNQRMDIQQRPPFIISDPHVRLQVEGTATPHPVKKLTFRAEAHTTAIPLSSVTYKIELYNFVTQTWEVFVRPASNSDAVQDVEITVDPERFIEAGTRKVRSRLSWRAYALTPNWGGKIDQTVWITVR